MPIRRDAKGRFAGGGGGGGGAKKGGFGGKGGFKPRTRAARHKAIDRKAKALLKKSDAAFKSGNRPLGQKLNRAAAAKRTQKILLPEGKKMHTRGKLRGRVRVARNYGR